MHHDIRDGESNEDYHADKAWLSKSQLWDLRSSGPAVFYGRHVAGTVPSKFATDSMSRGSLIHEWAEVGNDAWWGRVVEIPVDSLGAKGRRTKATDEFETEIRKAKPDAILLKADEVASYRGQLDAILANPVFQELTEATTHRELSIRWRDPATNLPLKCRPDAIAGATVWDIKTTSEQLPLEDFWKAVLDYGYHFQDVHYTAGIRAAGLEVDRFVFLVTSTVPPFACHAVTLPQALLSKAMRIWRSTLEEVSNRLELDHWLPADSGTVTELYIPGRYLEDKGHGVRSRQSWIR